MSLPPHREKDSCSELENPAAQRQRETQILLVPKFMDTTQITNIFSYHKPFGDQQGRYEGLRITARLLAEQINSACPESREKSLAITSLQQTIMWANASIAINEKET